MSRTAVIIPYYSREAGTLTQAVRSALCQENVETPTIIVVDDESPRPAHQDLAEAGHAGHPNVHVIRRRNGGPAAARNTGLDAIPADTTWVAFLDADDVWESQHLFRAQCALEQGYDFFFGNAQRIGRPTHFELANFDPKRHVPLPVLDELYAFEGDFFTRNLNYSPVWTSTCVMRKSILECLRIWEDLMLWLEIAARTDRIAFDGTLQAQCGAGSITETDGWRSNAELRRNLSYRQHFLSVRNHFKLTPAQSAIVDRALAKNTGTFVAALLALLRDGGHPDPQVLWEYVKVNPRVIVAVIGFFFRRLYEKGRGHVTQQA